MTAQPVLARLARGEAHGLHVLVVAAHPDDETIGIGGTLVRLERASVLHVTDGAPRDGRDAAMHGFATTADYAAARRREALAALAIAGIGADSVLALDVPDQQACLNLAAMARAIADAVAQLRPDLVVTHAYEGGHPDHDATAFAVRAALRIAVASPPLAEMTGYHAAPGGIVVGRFLTTALSTTRLPLTEAARAAKRGMLDCFATQRAVLARFPIVDELLRPAPPADFTAPPHPGELFYERFPWGMDGARFRALAAAALEELEGAGCG